MSNPSDGGIVVDEPYNDIGKLNQEALRAAIASREGEVNYDELYKVELDDLESKKNVSGVVTGVLWVALPFGIAGFAFVAMPWGAIGMAAICITTIGVTAIWGYFRSAFNTKEKEKDNKKLTIQRGQKKVDKIRELQMKEVEEEQERRPEELMKKRFNEELETYIQGKINNYITRYGKQTGIAMGNTLRQELDSNKLNLYSKYKERRDVEMSIVEAKVNVGDDLIKGKIHRMTADEYKLVREELENQQTITAIEKNEILGKTVTGRSLTNGKETYSESEEKAVDQMKNGLISPTAAKLMKVNVRQVEAGTGIPSGELQPYSNLQTQPVNHEVVNPYLNRYYG